MDPKIVKTNGRRLGNAAAVGEMLGIKADTFQWYVRESKPTGNPPPGHIRVDTETSQRMYDLKQVKAWNDSRTGRGNWNGIGARARKPKDEGVEQVEQPAGDVADDPAGETVEGAPLAEQDA